MLYLIVISALIADDRNPQGRPDFKTNADHKGTLESGGRFMKDIKFAPNNDLARPIR